MAIRNPAQARRERAHEAARQEILDAAASLFARRGYAAATLADLAQAAGYAAPSLYRYFESKEEIFRSLLERTRAELSATFSLPVDRAAPLRARLAVLFEAQWTLGRRRRDVLNLMTDGPEAPGCQPSDLQTGFELYERQLADWLRRNASRRELGCSPDHAAMLIAGVAHGLHHKHLLAPTAPDHPTPPIDVVVDLILHGISPRPASAGPRGVTP